MKKAFSYLTDTYRQHPLRVIMLTAFLVRLVAVFFSKGYGMLDDHFLVVEKAQQLVNGNVSDFWTPGTGEDGGNSKRSLLYPYLHYLLFSLLEAMGIYDPQDKMWVVRLLHALYSLLTIYFAYRLTLLLSNERVARLTGWIAALLWFLPMFSVRNLIEVVSMPLLLGGSYYAVLGYQKKMGTAAFLIAGLFLGFAFSIRYQTFTFTAGMGFFFLLKKNWKALGALTAGTLLPLLLNHFLLESVVFGYPPFGKPFNYIRYNLMNATAYVTSPWYNYVLLLLGIFIPPFSLFLLAGMFRAWRKQLIVFLPFMLFFVFHSAFPNKQERFITPVILYFPILGLIGYEALQQGNDWFRRHRRWFSVSLKIFWGINLLALIVVTTTYSKRSKVESMYYLSKKDPPEILLLCGSRRGDISSLPTFYLGHQPQRILISTEAELEAFSQRADSLSPAERPDYLLLFDQDKLESRLAVFRSVFPQMEFETRIEASHLDRLLHWLNPKNKNYDVLIYRIPH